jgi:asparagine synthase (glutamine-hydrolysing)
LAIIDLSPSGGQPMISDDGLVGVTFNGCIYNFATLRKELEGEGARFRSNCDTEVLVHGYRHWGIDRLVQRLRGMFAFAVWDDTRRSLTIVRDRLGVKPVLYRVDGDRLTFASTLPAITASSSGDCTIDKQAVLAFLEYGYVPEEDCIYREVHKLEAATILEWRGGRITKRSYWNLPEVDERTKVDFDEAVEETERLLVESVRQRLVADAPLAALLSAGVDSGLICWALTRLNSNVKAYSVSTPGEVGDESRGAAQTAAHVGIPLEIVPMGEHRPQELLHQLSDAFGEPFACSSALGVLQVSEVIKREASVVLTGDGGDDVFLGYPFHRHFYLAQKLANMTPTPLLRLWPHVRGFTPTWNWCRRSGHFLDYASGGLGAVTRAHDGLPYFIAASLLSGGELDNASLRYRELPLSTDSARKLLPEFIRFEQGMHFRSEFLTKVDGGSMYYSMEARSPLLDQELWEFAARLPFSIRLRGLVLKAILRKIADRRLGLAISRRRKTGFTIPVESYLSGSWSDELFSLESGTLLEDQGWIGRGALSRHLALLKSKKIGVAAQLWRLVVLERWLRREKSARRSSTPSHIGVGPTG